MNDYLLPKEEPGVSNNGTVVASIANSMQGLVSKMAGEKVLYCLGEWEGYVLEIMLDTEVSGTRYLLVRAQPKLCRPGSKLSPREQEIARMVAAGYPNKTIAAVLDISSWTVCTHLRRIFIKLGVSSRAAMVAQLIRDGVIDEYRSADSQVADLKESLERTSRVDSSK